MKVKAFLGATALMGTLVLAPSVSAQTSSRDDTGQQLAEEQVAEAEAGAEIVVTGSRINRPNLASTIPITSVGPQDILATGTISVGDQLNELPQLRATYSQANSTRFIGTAGSNFLDLRGLGIDRTLVLINGRRHVSTSPGGFQWDVNNVNADLLERVDVVTGGNSAIYGSDAVAGVVNFILKRDYDGLQLRGQGGISGEGDRGSYSLSGIAGKNFAEGRGNITVALEYAKANPLFYNQREQGRDRRQFQLVQNTSSQNNPSNGPIRGAEPSTGDGIPDTAFIGGLRRTETSEYGLFVATCPVAPAAGESTAAFNARRGLACSGLFNPNSSNALAQFGNGFVFQNDGTLIRNPCGTDFRPFQSGNCIGGLGSTLRGNGQFQPGLERFNANINAAFEVSPAFRPFVEASYTRVNALQESSPTFGTYTLSTANPFLTDQARALLQSVLAPGVTTFTIGRNNQDFGPRGERHKRETFRIVGGVGGSFADNFRYEVSANYGRYDGYYETGGNILSSGSGFNLNSPFGKAVNAVAAPAGYTGTNFVTGPNGVRAICAVNGDASTANDDPNCVPANLFGIGNVDPRSLAYFGYTSWRKQRNEQFVLSGFLSGDTASFFNLPGGPVGFAVGGEYRTEKQFATYDPRTAAGETFLNIIPAFTPPTYKIKEAYAEVRFPLLANTPFFHELTVEGAARVSDYNLGQTGTVWAWNGGVTWAPVRDLRFRGSYQQSVRAPTLGNLFNAASQTFNNAFADPCSTININNNPNRVRNCAAAGVPTTQTFTVGGVTTTEPFTNRPNGGVAAANTGNPLLREERGRSFTLGGVFQPSALPGFNLSVDYWNIEVKNVIFTLAPQTVLEQCYDNPSGIDNPFCASVNRLPNGTFAGQTTVIQGGSVVTINNPGFSTFGRPFNYARQKTSGIDVDAGYRHDFGDGVTFNIRGLASYLIKRDNYTDISQPDFINQQKFELGDPEWRFQVTNILDTGAVSFNYQVQYIGKQILNGFEYETFFPLQGRAPYNPDATPFPYYPAQWYHNIRAEFDLQQGSQFYVGVDNFTNTRPPYDLLGNEAGSLYDPTGRFFYAGFRAKF
ncbi:MAG: TonB-dependent receptor [Sphingomonas ginsenosidimutans]|jgi:outer membrane receptor protein involved in Fe transport|uniref:TonB-dependent receptor n=1 Tax=Sphingomonas ginsenosidimutans TaxID=862134 RepID=A0A2A4HYW5_9SPHN|nr:TonB-dependent receptor [Sphingomonas ginsenosidimutans]PCG09560.1 TonB-dependent receptor [Sphingomonas ginsenosidimutans]